MGSTKTSTDNPSPKKLFTMATKLLLLLAVVVAVCCAKKSIKDSYQKGDKCDLWSKKMQCSKGLTCQSILRGGVTGKAFGLLGRCLPRKDSGCKNIGEFCGKANICCGQLTCYDGKCVIMN